jgi:hypothetical protein
LWWLHEQLHRRILLNYADRIKPYSAERDQLENLFMQDVAEISSGARAAFTGQAFIMAGDFTRQWIENFKDHPVAKRTRWLYRQYWQKQNKKAGILIQ